MLFVAPSSAFARLCAGLVLILGVLALGSNGPAEADVPALGVLEKEIVVGTHVDLSGPLKPWGTAVRNGLSMAIEEANKGGGINQRTVRLIVRDDAYDPAKAVEAARVLTNQDHVFAILSPLGAPTAKAAMTQALS